MTQDESFSKEMAEVLIKYNAELVKKTMSEQQQAIAKVKEDFVEKQNLKNHNERVGGSLYNSYTALVKEVKNAPDGVWTDQDKKDLCELGEELLKFVDTNKKNIREILELLA